MAIIVDFTIFVKTLPDEIFFYSTLLHGLLFHCIGTGSEWKNVSIYKESNFYGPWKSGEIFKEQEEEKKAFRIPSGRCGWNFWRAGRICSIQTLGKTSGKTACCRMAPTLPHHFYFRKLREKMNSHRVLLRLLWELGLYFPRLPVQADITEWAEQPVRLLIRLTRISSM